MSDVEFVVDEEVDVDVGGVVEEGGVREEDPILQELRNLEGDTTGARLSQYIFDEVNAILEGQTRGDFLDKLGEWRKAREGIPEQETKSYPWEDASNIRVPTTMINVQGVYALLKGNFSSRAPLWTIEGKSEADKGMAKGLQALISYCAESKDHANVREANTTIFYNSVAEGLSVVKVPWVEETYFYRDNKTSESIPVIRRNSPLFKPVPNEHFLIRPEWQDFQRAPWIGSADIYYDHELVSNATKNIFDPEAVERVRAAGGDPLSSIEVQALEGEGKTPSSEEDSKRFLLVEVFVFWDLFEDGQYVDLVLTIHPASDTILRAEFNDLRYRPYFNVGYGTRPFSLQQLGVCQALEGVQQEVDFLHNARVDAIHMEVSPMIAVSLTSTMGGNEEAHPGKVVRVSDASKDMRFMQINSITQGALEAEMVSQGQAERISGMSSGQAGFDSPIAKSGATASGTMFLAQQGSKIFTAQMEVTKDHYSEGGKILAFQILTHSEIAALWIPHLPDEVQADAKLALETITPEMLPSRFLFDVQTTEMEKTEEARKQALITAIQLQTTYGQQATQLAMAIYNPQMQLPEQVKDVLQRQLIAQTELMEQALKDLNQTQGSKNYVAYVKDIELMVEARAAMMNQQIGGLGNGGQNQGGVGQVNRGGGPQVGVGAPGSGAVPPVPAGPGVEGSGNVS